MDKILDFLANNYIYFLIGAGVLFFALIGFIVDLKKRNKSEEGTTEVATEIPTPVVPVAPVTPEPVATIDVPGIKAEEYRPVPPMPQATPEVVSVAQESVQPVQTPVAPVQLVVEEPQKTEIEEL